MDRVSKTNAIAFGNFELDLADGMLRQHGTPVSLSPKEFETLRLLLEKSPHLVTKEEFFARIWPDTFVGESSLARNISVLRKLIGDDMIETVAKRGYRFTAAAAATAIDSPEVAAQSIVAGKSAKLKRNRPGWHWWMAGFAALAFLVLAWAPTYWFPGRRPGSIPELRLTQLTLNSNQKPVHSGAISPDGKYLAYTDLDGIHLQLIETGELRTIASNANGKENREWSVVGWLSGSTSFVANLYPRDQNRASIWTYSILDESPHQLRDNAEAWSTSRDGSQIAFGSKFLRMGPAELWTMDARGEHEQKVLEAETNASVQGAQFSPDGRWFAYVKHVDTGDHLEQILETRLLRGGPANKIVMAPNICGHVWLPDGRLMYGLRETTNLENSNYWTVGVDLNSGRVADSPRRVTNWAGFGLAQISATSDGKRLAFLASVDVAEEYLADYSSGGHISTPKRLALDGMNAPLAWTPDSKTIILNSVRNGRLAILRQSLDTGSIEPIVMNKGQHATGVRLSPDGAWIFYSAVPDDAGPSSRLPLMRVPVSGGPSQYVLQTASSDYRCSVLPASLCVISDRSADRKQLIWTSFDAMKGPLNEVARMDTDVNALYDWALSPDGRIIVIRKEREARLGFLDLTTRKLRFVSIEGWKFAVNLDWSPDGKGVFTCGIRPEGGVLLYVDLKGRAQPIWEYSGDFLWGLLSPDGRHLAMGAQTQKNNIWMMENF